MCEVFRIKITCLIVFVWFFHCKTYGFNKRKGVSVSDLSDLYVSPQFLLALGAAPLAVCLKSY